MTIIAWDGHYLSADQRVTYGKVDDEYTLDHGQKLYRYTGDLLIKESPIWWIGLAGNAINAGKFLHLLNKAPAGELVDFTRGFGPQLSPPGFSLIMINLTNDCVVVEFKAFKGLFKPIVTHRTKLPVLLGSGCKISELVHSLEITDSRLMVQLGIGSDRGCGGMINYVTTEDTMVNQYTLDNQDQIQAAVKRFGVMMGLASAQDDHYWGF